MCAGGAFVALYEQNAVEARLPLAYEDGRSVVATTESELARSKHHPQTISFIAVMADLTRVVRGLCRAKKCRTPQAAKQTANCKAEGDNVAAILSATSTMAIVTVAMA